MKTYTVRFTVAYETIIVVPEGTSVDDAVSDIDIPENATCTYVDDSFEPGKPHLLPREAST